MKPISMSTLRACVRVTTSEGGGSGTVVYSALDIAGGYSTYILTNEHVVDNSITYAVKWHGILKREWKQEILGEVGVDFFKYQWEQRVYGAESVLAKIMAYDKTEDLALLKLKVLLPIEDVAKLYPKGMESNLKLTAPTTCIGCGLGEPPVVTKGVLSQFGRIIDNKEFWVQTAPFIFGNSGGAIFLEETEEFIGVPSLLPVVMLGFGADAITHMGLIVPITRVYEFLDAQMFRFIYDKTLTEEGEAKAREAKRKADEMRLADQERRGQSIEEPTSGEGK